MNESATRRAIIIITCLACLSLLFSPALSMIYGNWNVGSNWVIGPYWNISAAATTVTVTIVHPTNTTYNVHTISVAFSAYTSSGSIDKLWFNLQNASNWVYALNQTYTIPTSMNGITDGLSYNFWAWANATDGTLGSANVMFSVTSTVVSVTMTLPGSSLYNSTAPLQFSAYNYYGIDKEWYSLQNSSGSWLIVNAPYTDSTIVNLAPNATGTFYVYANANNTLGVIGTASTSMHIQAFYNSSSVPSGNIVYATSNFNIHYPFGSALGMQSAPYFTIMVTPTIGNFYGTNGNLWMTINQGNLTYYNLEATTIYVNSTDPSTTIYINNVEVTTPTSLDAGHWYQITWNYYGSPGAPGSPLPFGLPIIFIIGMVGLACMFIGPIYGIQKIRDREYRNGFVLAVIITAMGFALFIAWLYGGHF